MRNLSINNSNINYSQYPAMVGAMNVYTTRGEVKARSTDMLVVFPDGSSNVMTVVAFDLLFPGARQHEDDQDAEQHEAEKVSRDFKRVKQAYVTLATVELPETEKEFGDIAQPIAPEIAPETPGTTNPEPDGFI